MLTAVALTTRWRGFAEESSRARVHCTAAATLALPAGAVTRVRGGNSGLLLSDTGLPLCSSGSAMSAAFATGPGPPLCGRASPLPGGRPEDELCYRGGLAESVPECEVPCQHPGRSLLPTSRRHQD